MKRFFRNKPNVSVSFLLFLSVVVIAIFTMEMINNRFVLTDFKVYYTAAQKFFSGQPVYHVCLDSGSGYYKYSPVILFFFLPLSLIGYKAASVIYFFILGFAFWYTFHLLARLFMKYYFPGELKNTGWMMCLSFITILVYVVREMLLGNLNIILLLLAVHSAISFLNQKSFRGSFFLAMILLTKPFYFPLLFILIFRKKWRSLVWLVILLICGIVIPFIYCGVSPGFVHFKGWVSTMMLHDQSFPGYGTIFYFLSKQIFHSMPLIIESLIVVIVLSLLMFFVLSNIKLEKCNNNRLPGEQNFFFEWTLTLAFIPLMFKNDWVQFFLSAPVITFIIFYISAKKKYLLIPVLLIPLFFFSALSDDLLGKAITDLFLKSGLTGMSNLFIILFALLLFIKQRTRIPLKGESGH